MPDVIIKDMEMPESCRGCVMYDTMSCRILRRVVYRHAAITKDRPEDCPLRPAPEVVRCQECIHRPKRLEEYEDGDGFGLEFPDERCPCHCEDGWYSWMPPDDWFCANGERKKEGTP